VLADQYDLPLSTESVAARDAYVQGCELALTFYPGAIEAFDRASAADPGFAMPHAGKAQVLVRGGDVVGGRAALAAAQSFSDGISAREAGHIRFFELVFAGETHKAIVFLETHLAEWPRDALIVGIAANPNGLIGGSGQIGQKRQIAVLMDRLAPHYGDDAWFLSFHAMALSEDGRLAEAQAKIDRSLALTTKNAHGAHGYAHICYESGALEASRSFLTPWLQTYPRNGFFHGHLSWHLSLCELQAGNFETARNLYRDAITPNRHSGGPQQKLSDGAGFLWRSELAGLPRDNDAWLATYNCAKQELPRPTGGLADLHVILAQAVAGGDDVSRQARSEEISRQERYLSGDFLPAVGQGIRAFERGDPAGAIAALSPLADESERIGGSRAQHDLIAFTLMRAYLDSGRLDEARDWLRRRRPGASGVPVEGIAALA
jgi:tetratricopeptide (TPR) repeat protein